MTAEPAVVEIKLGDVVRIRDGTLTSAGTLYVLRSTPLRTPPFETGRRAPSNLVELEEYLKMQQLAETGVRARQEFETYAHYRR